MTITLEQFEEKFGGMKIDQLERALAAAQNVKNEINVAVPSEDNVIKFAVIGDTQFGNVCEATDELVSFVHRCYTMGITTFLHTGDVLDGWKVYAGQEYELHSIGFSAQMDHMAKVLRRLPPDCRFHFITGNHDASLKKLAGVHVGHAISDRFTMWHFVGEDHGDVTLRTAEGFNYKVRLLHPDGGTAYAISYRLQKLIEAIEGGTKPRMLCVGHFHKAEHLPNYRNVDGIQSGCFEWQTPFMARKGSPAHVGGWVVQVTLDPLCPEVAAVQAEFISFYKVR